MWFGVATEMDAGLTASGVLPAMSFSCPVL
jgi:hypothetical protein